MVRSALLKKTLTGMAMLFMVAHLGACAALGGGKNPPDEFAITTKAPLVVPPDFALRPPKPGETRPQELTSSQRAQQVLLGDPNAAPPSDGEILLLEKSGALKSDRNIRNILNAENGGRAEKEAGIANQLIFWKFNADGTIDDSQAPLSVEDQEKWLADRQKSIIKIVGEEGVVEIGNEKVLNLPGVF